jgi:hypothetical protein
MEINWQSFREAVKNIKVDEDVQNRLALMAACYLLQTVKAEKLQVATGLPAQFVFSQLSQWRTSGALDRGCYTLPMLRQRFPVVANDFYDQLKNGAFNSMEDNMENLCEKKQGCQRPPRHVGRCLLAGVKPRKKKKGLPEKAQPAAPVVVASASATDTVTKATIRNNVTTAATEEAPAKTVGLPVSLINGLPLLPSTSANRLKVPTEWFLATMELMQEVVVSLELLGGKADALQRRGLKGLMSELENAVEECQDILESSSVLSVEL